MVQRNLQFLEDYLRIDSSQADRSGREWGLAMVSAEPGISLSELFRRAAEGISRDDIYALIATRTLYVDLGIAPLAEPERVHVFVNREAAVACGHAVQGKAPTDNSRAFTVRAGLTLAWDGRTWTILNPGDKTISLLGEYDALTELPASVFEKLTKEGRIHGLSARQKGEGRPEIAVLAAADEKDLGIANRRFNAVLCQLRGEPALADCQVSARTLRLWVSRYRKAEACFGGGYLGLLPRSGERGNRRSRLSAATKTLLLKSIENDYETLKQKTRLACWAALKRECDDSSIITPSYATFCATVRKRNRFTQVLKRLGRRAAYQRSGATVADAGNGCLQPPRACRVPDLRCPQLPLVYDGPARMRTPPRPPAPSARCRWRKRIRQRVLRRIAGEVRMHQEDPPTSKSAVRIGGRAALRHG